MTGRRAAIAFWLVVAVSASIAAGCALEELDAVDQIPGQDASTGADASAPDAEASVEAASSQACLGAVPPVREWMFDAGAEGWTLTIGNGVDAGLTWTSTTGDPSPGALEVDFTPPVTDAGTESTIWVHWVQDTNPVDLTGRTVAAWVWLDTPTSPRFLTFVQTQTEYAWADEGVVTLTPRTWTCVSLPLAMPAFSQPAYDPTHVIRIGFEMLGTSPFRIYIDSVRYQ
jgi:hypothetical protein